MGGFGSGKNFRYGMRTGNFRKRTYTTEVFYISYKSINIQDINPNNPVGKISYGGLTFDIRMKLQSLPNGNSWYSLLCSCGRGVRKLYFHNSCFACQRCHKLAYISENRGKTDRAIDQKWKYLHKLGCSIDFPVRPKGMREKTFKRLCEKINNYNDLSYARFFGYYKY